MAQQLTVLIVDDSPEDRHTYRRYLEQDQEHHYTILEEETGEGALDFCRQFQPDCILLDFLLPDQNGLQVLAELKQQFNSTMPAVIMLTGHGNEAVAVQAMKSGVQDYLVKRKTTRECLLDSMHSAIANCQLRSSLQFSEERFRTSVENMLDCLGIYTAIRDCKGKIIDFRIDYVNAAACEVNCMTKEEQLGKGLCEIFPNHRTSGLFDDYCRVVETGEPLVKESLVYKEFYGNQILTGIFDIRARKLGDGFVASWRDVTEKKLTEERWQKSQQFVERIAETTPGLLYVYDLVERRNVYVNRQIGELLGYTPEQIQAMGTELFPQILHPEDLARLPMLLQRFDSVQDGEIIETEYRLRHANGEWRWFFGREVVFSRNYDGSPRQILGTTMDITVRKEAEEQLRLSNERFQLATAAVNSLIYDCDVQNKIVTRTEGLTQIFGYSLEEAEPTVEWWHNLVHPDERERLHENFLNTIANNQNRYQVEYRVRHKDAKYRDVLDHGLIVYDVNGQPVRVVGSTTDISDRKRAEAALQESEAKFRRIVESNIVGIYFGDFTGRIYEANDAFLRIFGYTRDELQAGVIRWDTMTPPEYEELDKQKVQELQTFGSCTPFEKEYYSKDGTRVPILLGIAQMEGREDGYSACFVLDLTGRKQTEAALQESEERYRHLSEAMPQMVWTSNAKGEIEYLNQKWYEFTGQTVEEAMGFGWAEVLHSDDIQPVMQAWTIAVRRGTSYEIECRYRRHDGTYRWHLARALPIKDEQGQVFKWFGTSTDIDDRKQLETERDRLLELEKTARAQAEAANRAKDEFVAMVSHDLRSPLNAILGWAKLLRTRKHDEATVNRALETIERNAKSQAKLLEDLLDMSRILRGKLELEVSQINLTAIVMAAIETVYPTANAKNIHLETELNDSIPAINGDTNRLLQVLGNLLSNAIKFTPEGGRIEVRLTLERQGATGVGGRLGDGETTRQAATGVGGQGRISLSCPVSFASGVSLVSPASGLSSFAASLNCAFPATFAQITVTDTGVGISPEFLPYIFERYRQADRTHRQGGLGLGLAIARHLIELHGGTIHVDSAGVGQGATFTIKLPLLGIS